MLSFLQDENIEENKASESPDAPASSDAPAVEQPKQQEEYLTVSARSENVRKGTYVLFVLFGIGLLGLWFMVKKSTPQSASAAIGISSEKDRLDSAMSRLDGDGAGMFGQTKEIVGRFYESSTIRQVEVNKLKKNPFKTEKLSYCLKQIRQSEELESLSAANMQRTSSFELLSICESLKGRSCMIGDEVLYEGDSIKDFKVEQIGDDFVKLQSADGEIVLEIQK